MAPPRRESTKGSQTRSQLLDAAEQILAEDGYAAVTSRAVANRVGVNAGLVHYYFPTLDDLFVALFDRGADRSLERIAAALASREPLLALWRLSSDRRGVAVFMELMAAANHRKALHNKVVTMAKTTRRMQVEALRELLPQYELDPVRFPPALVAATIQGLALLIAREGALGLGSDTDDAADAIEAFIEDLEQRRDTAQVRTPKRDTNAT